jgi:hypothetical protein
VTYIPSAETLLAPLLASDSDMGLAARRIHQQISILGSLYRLADAASVEPETFGLPREDYEPQGEQRDKPWAL